MSEVNPATGGMTEAAIEYIDPIDTQLWVRDPERPGYLKLERVKTVREVFEALRDRCMDPSEFGFHTAVGCDEYFSLMVSEAALWPSGRTVVYAVTGGSEGHYVHVGVNTDEGKHETLILGKTFDGWDNAWAFAKSLAKALNV